VVNEVLAFIGVRHGGFGFGGFGYGFGWVSLVLILGVFALRIFMRSRGGRGPFGGGYGRPF
jgi:hypothetical protein